MSAKKEAAIDICNDLHRENKIGYPDYLNLMDAICEFDTLEERDVELEALWEQLADVPVDPDTEKLEEPYLHFPIGTDKLDIWGWFDKRYSKGVSYLLYRDGTDRTMETAELLYRKQLCTECDAERCAYNPNGVCMVPFLTGKTPRLHDDGCHDFCYKDGGEE